MGLYKMIFAFLNIYLMFASAQDEAVEIVTIATTTQEVVIITDLPQSVVDEALKIEVGEYTTMAFDYINTQFSKLNPVDKCMDDYIKCSVTKGLHMPVCAVSHYGFNTFSSYCELYLDNCRRLERAWWALDVGLCEYSDVVQTRRRLRLLGAPWKFIFKIPDPNLELNPRHKYLI